MIRRYFFIGLLSILLFSCGQKEKAKLTIATAANVQFAMKELVELFTQEEGIPANIVISSSGQLTAQIKQGAPFDLFVSANMKYPEELYRSGFTTGAPAVYAYGKLVLWTAEEAINPSIDSLDSPSINHIALANPKNAPYGQAGVEVLQHYQVFDKVASKLVYGESISQTNQFIVSGAAEIGFTAKSVVVSPTLVEKGKWIEIDQNTYTPIAQGVVIIKKDDQIITEAEKFYSFLFSQKAKAVLEKYGYQLKD